MVEGKYLAVINVLLPSLIQPISKRKVVSDHLICWRLWGLRQLWLLSSLCLCTNSHGKDLSSLSLCSIAAFCVTPNRTLNKLAPQTKTKKQSKVMRNKQGLGSYCFGFNPLLFYRYDLAAYHGHPYRPIQSESWLTGFYLYMISIPFQ